MLAHGGPRDGMEGAQEQLNDDEQAVAHDAARARLARALAVAGGSEPRMNFELLVAMTMSSDAASTLRTWNEYLDTEGARRVLDLTTAVMLTVSRMSQTMRCEVAISEIVTLLGHVQAHCERAVDETDEAAVAVAAEERSRLQAELSARASTLASALAAHRKFMTINKVVPRGGFMQTASSATFDPRLLGFEFLSTFLLRGQQLYLE